MAEPLDFAIETSPAGEPLDFAIETSPASTKAAIGALPASTKAAPGDDGGSGSTVVDVAEGTADMLSPLGLDAPLIAAGKSAALNHPLVAAARGEFSPLKTFEEELDFQRGLVRRRRENKTGAANAGRVAGVALPMLLTAGAGAPQLAAKGLGSATSASRAATVGAANAQKLASSKAMQEALWLAGVNQAARPALQAVPKVTPLGKAVAALGGAGSKVAGVAAKPGAPLAGALVGGPVGAGAVKGAEFAGKAAAGLPAALDRALPAAQAAAAKAGLAAAGTRTGAALTGAAALPSDDGSVLQTLDDLLTNRRAENALEDRSQRLFDQMGRKAEEALDRAAEIQRAIDTMPVSERADLTAMKNDAIRDFLEARRVQDNLRKNL